MAAADFRQAWLGIRRIAQRFGPSRNGSRAGKPSPIAHRRAPEQRACDYARNAARITDAEAGLTERQRSLNSRQCRTGCRAAEYSEVGAGWRHAT